MDDAPQIEKPEIDHLQHLKRVSRVKHRILARYLPPWARILGSTNSLLTYVDCFAGPGQYEMDGQPVEGSPIIAVREAIGLVQRSDVRNLTLYLVDEDPKQIEKLENHLKSLQPYPPSLKVEVACADSRAFVMGMLNKLVRGTPAFFLIDPYGHPLPLPIIRTILQRPRTEVLINLMWFMISRDINNPKVRFRLDELFGNTSWQSQPFVTMHGEEREEAFLTYFKSQLGAKFVLPFRIRFDLEDIRGGRGTKYYLLHASNHIKAALLMKEAMWPLGDEEGTFDFSGESQGILISRTPTEEQLNRILLQAFAGKEVSFDNLREQTWELPFIEKYYRAVVKQMEGKEVVVRRITSKKTGIKGDDRILFK
jgi:three-Cys-motif partner protein